MEGVSSFKLIQRLLPNTPITIADKDENVLDKINFRTEGAVQTILGEGYISNLDDYDIILKSPGIPNGLLTDKVDKNKITSQTDLFLRLFATNTTGVTGTKGKSTTSSLIKHILSNYYNDVFFVGNIGVPPFDMIERIGRQSRIVFELSSHQLENISIAPHIAIILNLYQEHLDHYGDFNNYQLAKFNITKFQSKNDWLIYNADDDFIKQKKFIRNTLQFSSERKVPFGAFLSKRGEVVFNDGSQNSVFVFNNRLNLPGNHNLMNIMATVCACKLLKVPDEIISESIREFKGLEHRLEYVGKFSKILFYNDSIATIPEATIEAVKALKIVDTLILGGKDRGIDYKKLAVFLADSKISNLIYLGEAGKRIFDEMKYLGLSKNKRYFQISNFGDIKSIVKQHTKPKHICLLSPAASSYDMFRNFEERGEAYKEIVRNI